MQQQQGMMMPQQGMMMPQQGMMMQGMQPNMMQPGMQPNMMQPGMQPNMMQPGMMMQPPPQAMPIPAAAPAAAAVIAVNAVEEKEDGHVPVTSKSSKNWVCIGLGMFLLVIGAGCVFAGMNSLKEAELMNPEEDFIPRECTIDEIDYDFEVKETTTCKQRKSNCSGNNCCREWETVTRCTEWYTYEFYDDEDPSEKYNTKEYVYQRSSEVCDGEDEGEFRREGVACYKPAVEKLPSGYECHNDECMKVHDPALDKANLEGSGSTLMAIGGILVVLGVLIVI